MMKFRFTVLATILYFSMLPMIQAQQLFSISGKVYDTITKQPLAGVYVNVTSVSGSSEKVTVVTDEKGVFSISNLPANQNYQLRCTF